MNREKSNTMDNATIPLLEEWAKWKPNTLPFALRDDLEALTASRRSQSIAILESWDEACTSHDLGWPKDQRLHLGLIPQPFFGDLKSASVYILMLNPGLGPHDYYGENEVKLYRKALLSNLKQRFGKRSTKFLFLDPRFAWHGGFQFWNGKLSEILRSLSDEMGESLAKARKWLGNHLASIELVPYHSATGPTAKWIMELPSVSLARSFAQQYVFERVRSGKAVAVVTRSRDKWDLPSHKKIVEYTNGQARGAHLTLRTSGGRLILDHLRTFFRFFRLTA